MLKALHRRVVRLALAVALAFILIGQPLVTSPQTVMPVFAGECHVTGGSTCNG
jgi:hypothetical protein